MDFDAIIELLGADEPDIAGAIEGLGGLRTASEGASARIAELEQEVSDLEAKYMATAAKNWELTQAVTGEPKDGEQGDGEQGDGEDEPMDDEEVYSELFEEED